MSNAREIAQLGSVSSGRKNIIINGDMRIDQRNNGGSVALSGSAKFSADRFTCYGPASGSTSTAQQVADAPAGFTNSLKYSCGTGVSVTGSDYASFVQGIEGYNSAHLNWGTSDAKNVVLSFWVKSTLTGDFSINVQNNGNARSFVTQYTINSANTWEHKTIQIAGDTSGTWLTNNGVGIYVNWDMGFGYGSTATADSWQSGDFRYITGSVKINETSGASLNITGVQLEVGSVATEFEHRSYGEELALCQRYYVSGDIGSDGGYGYKYSAITTIYLFNSSGKFLVEMRTSPTISASNVVYYNCSSLNISSVSTKVFLTRVSASAGSTYRAIGQWEADAEI
jgi:hypothetical protein